MAFGGDVDTLNLTFDKLQYIFNGYGQVRESFLEINTTYKQGRISDAEFFDKVQEGVLRFSALEFLAIKAIFEIKKSMDRSARDANVDSIQGNLSIPQLSPPSHSIASFITVGNLPRPQQINPPTKQGMVNCIHCGNQIKMDAKFCTNCGKKP